MPRFASLDYAPAETRRLLRDRFKRNLGFAAPPRQPHSDRLQLSDEAMLILMQSLELRFGNDEAEARSIYRKALPPGSQEPEWDDLIARGWTRLVWGRYAVNFDLYDAARKATDLTALTHWMAHRYEQTPRLGVPLAQLPAEVQTVAEGLTQANVRLRDVTCQDPAWVAARLWDRHRAQAASPNAALRVWFDCWTELGQPELVPMEAWAPADAAAFRDAALEVIEGETDLLGWRETRERFIRETALARGQAESHYTTFFDPLPATFLERVLWLGEPRQEHPVCRGVKAAEALFGLTRLLWADVAAQPNAPAPHPIVACLLGLARDRPELLAMLLYLLHAQPELLADVLLNPPTAALACLLVAQSQSPGSAYDRTLIEQDHEMGRAAAFRDAVGILGRFLERGEASAEDTGALLAWLHDQARKGFIDDAVSAEPLRALLRTELFALPEYVVVEIIASLCRTRADLRLERGGFPAILELAEMSPITNPVCGKALVDAYVYGLSDNRPNVSVRRISAAGAAVLATLPIEAADRKRLLGAVDVRGRLAGAASDHNPYILAGEIGRALRSHIRVLSRAVVGLAPAPLPDLVEALIAAVKAGAEDHATKNRVAAFAPHFETGDFAARDDRPIAQDLAGALRALVGRDQDRLLDAILGTDEPMVLAGLLPLAPLPLRPRIERRIDDLPPANAAEVHSLTEVQARVDSLLSAGTLGPATAYMDAELAAKPWGRPAGRELARFTATLRLQLANKDWGSILSAQPPPDLPALKAADAWDTITFYRGLAFLLRTEDRAPEAAEQAFGELHRRKPHVTSYAQNLIAARVTRLLPDDLFAQLDGANARRARQILGEIDAVVGNRAALDATGRATLVGNEALLRLALGEPEAAFAALAGLPEGHTDPRAMAYQAVALARLGRSGEATAVLKTANDIAGPSPFFDAVRAHIQSGKGVETAVGVAIADDRLTSIRSAFYDFMQLDAHCQAEVLGGSATTLEGYLTGQVRAASTSLINLVPMMKRLTLDSCEDDLNALLREFLLSRLHLQKWGVPDQSLGGFTAKGNPGERDLTIVQDTISLCAIEAVICQNPVRWQTVQANLRMHFQKLFGYGSSRILYHLTYAYDSDLAAIQSSLKTMAAAEAPTGYVFSDQQDISSGDSSPAGFKAQYRDNRGELTMVFLILDLGQSLQRQAAIQARSEV